MKIEFRNESHHGQNAIADMFINEVFACTIRCRPVELHNLIFLLVQAKTEYEHLGVLVMRNGKTLYNGDIEYDSTT